MLVGVAGASVQQGDTELDLLGSFIDTNATVAGGDTSELFVDVRLGYFVTDNIQIGISAFASWAEEGNRDTDTFGIGPVVKYHFMPTNQWVPYVGGQAFWSRESNGQDVDGLVWGPLAGLRYELNVYNDLFIEYQYRMFESDLGDIFDDAHAILVGIVHQFK